MRLNKSDRSRPRRRGALVLVLAGSCLVEVKGDRAYPLGCLREAPSYYDYDNYPFPPPGVSIQSTKDYLLLRRLGAGKFSDVFEAIGDSSSSESDVLVVLKCLKPVSDRKIRRELLVLSHASRLPNLARLRGLVMPESSSQQHESSRRSATTKLQPMPTLVLEHAGRHSQWLCHGRPYDPTSHTSTNTASQNNTEDNDAFLSDYEIKYFLCHLLIALDALHSEGIMHRDVKPRNVLINRAKRANNHANNNELPLMLIDLGLADFYLPNTRYNVRVASRHYKSPELLIGYENYDYAIDMWGLGCILAGLLLRREPFFRGKDNVDQLGKIVSVLGTADLVSYITKCGVDVTPEMRKVIAKYNMRGGGRKQSWLSFLPENCPIPSREGLDLLDKLLVYDHDIRLTAQQAMQHSFFDQVRDRVTAEVNQRSNRDTGREGVSSERRGISLDAEHRSVPNPQGERPVVKEARDSRSAKRYPDRR